MTLPMPTYDSDTEAATGIQEGAQQVARRLVASDTVVLSSPEYNAACPTG